MITLPTWFVATYLGLIGAVVGSFLNVVIARLPEGVSLVRPRSRCPRCAHAIAWYDNIPLASWLWLRAKCRHCKAPIAVRYPLVEAITASLFVAVYAELGLSYDLLLWLPLTAAFVAIVFLDIDHWWIPDVIVFPGMLLALGYAFVPGGLSPQAALFGVLPALFIWGVAWVFARVTGKEGLGLGDVKLLALLGLALGPVAALTILLLASVQGSVIGILVLLMGGHKPQVEAEPKAAAPAPEARDASEADEPEWTPPPRAIPFGPFLVLGAFEVLLLPQWCEDLPHTIGSTLLGIFS